MSLLNDDTPIPQQLDRQRKFVAWTIGGASILCIIIVFGMIVSRSLRPPRLPVGSWQIIKANCEKGEFTLTDPCSKRERYEVKIDLLDLEDTTHTPFCRDIKPGEDTQPANILVNDDRDYMWHDGEIICAGWGR